jgi:hypothetical protein
VTRFDDAADPVGHPSRFDDFIQRWIAEGMTGDEIVDQLGTIPSVNLSLAGRRETFLRISALRGLPAHDPDGPTEYALQKIAEIKKEYPRLRRRSRSAAAKRVGVDRGSIPRWEGRGWMTWPPG